MSPRCWVGVDVGGTFTDLVHRDCETGRIALRKVRSTPDDPGRAVLEALSAADIDVSSIDRFRHGATVATNAVLERSGASLGVITTAGFRDVLIVGKGNRTRLYDIRAVRPPGLVSRANVLEVAERLGPGGDVLVPLDETAVREAALTLRDRRIEAVAVCFLHAYANAEHEQRAAQIVRAQLPGIPVCCSAEVLAEHREFERFSTTALNAYVSPKMAVYLNRLDTALRASGLSVAPEIMASGGGSWSFGEMARLPVNSVLSGPAGGVIGTLALAKALGRDNVISYDMGGTSTDTCLIQAGRYPLGTEGRIGGLPNRVPQIEINTVGAGGGSLAYLDAGGFLNVGPRSAGAIPGPACYGLGGCEPTVTDANVVLGRFRPTAPLGGELFVNVQAAATAVDQLAVRLKLSRDATAEGIVRIAVARMTGAIKEISVMRGIDPRDFDLVAFGGAGPLHAALIATELAMRTVIVPPLCGAFSAYGLLVAERRKDTSVSRLLPLTGINIKDLEAAFAPLRHKLAAAFAAEGFTTDELRFDQIVDLRFEGQAFELNVPFDESWTSIDELEAAFHRLYEQRYAHADQGPLEAVAFRVAAFGHSAEAAESFGALEMRSPESAAAPTATGERRCRFDGTEFDTALFDRDALRPGQRFGGPALIEENGATTLVPPGFEAEVHPSGALLLRLERSSMEDCA